MVAPILAAVHWDLFPCTHIVLTLAIDSTSCFLEGKLQISARLSLEIGAAKRLGRELNVAGRASNDGGNGIPWERRPAVEERLEEGCRRGFDSRRLHQNPCVSRGFVIAVIFPSLTAVKSPCKHREFRLGRFSVASGTAQLGSIRTAHRTRGWAHQGIVLGYGGCATQGIFAEIRG